MKIDSVQQTVKTELRTWADVAERGVISKPITKNTVKKAVRSVNDEEKRSGCFLIHVQFGRTGSLQMLSLYLKKAAKITYVITGLFHLLLL
jgi:hypothetical protein